MAAVLEILNLGDLIKSTIEGELVEQTVTRLVPSGENFGSVIYKVDFTMRSEGEQKTYHGVAKCTPPNKVTQEIFQTQVTFKSEIGWYTTVIPTYQQFQKDHGVENVADFFQKLYGARISLDPGSEVVDENAVILTENLISMGYKNEDRHVGFNLRTSKAILRDLATFHAIPFAIKKQDPSLFENKVRPFLPVWKESDEFQHGDPMVDIKRELGALPELAPYMDRLLNVLDTNKPFDNNESIREEWGSVCHGDFWTNNIMVKDAEDPQVIILDLQTPSFSSIAGDVLFFLALSVRLDVVKEHIDELIEFYFDSLLRKLSELDVDTNTFSFDDFQDELKARAKRQLGHALFIGQFVFMEKGHKHFDSSDEKFKKDDLEANIVRFNDVHKKRFSWLITEFARRNWI